MRYGDHKKSFCHEQHRKSTELSNVYWRLKELNAISETEFSILKKFPPTRRKVACHLCLYKKLFKTEYKGDNLLNQRNELISKFRHKNKLISEKS